MAGVEAERRANFYQEAPWISKEHAVRELSGNEAKLLLEIQGTAHNQGHICDRTQQQLSAATGIAMSTIGPTSHSLHAKGFIFLEKKANAWGARTYQSPKKGRRGSGPVQYFLEQSPERYYEWRKTRPERKRKVGVFGPGNKVQSLFRPADPS